MSWSILNQRASRAWIPRHGFASKDSQNRPTGGGRRIMSSGETEKNPNIIFILKLIYIGRFHWLIILDRYLPDSILNTAGYSKKWVNCLIGCFTPLLTAKDIPRAVMVIETTRWKGRNPILTNFYRKGHSFTSHTTKAYYWEGLTLDIAISLPLPGIPTGEAARFFKTGNPSIFSRTLNITFKHFGHCIRMRYHWKQIQDKKLYIRGAKGNTPIK